MKYMCVNKDDKTEYGAGLTLEEAIKDFNDNWGFCLNLQWYDLTPVTVQLVVVPTKKGTK